MAARFERFFIPVVVGFAPVLLLILTWAPEQLTPVQGVVRSYFLPVLAAEVIVIALAVRSGLIGAMAKWQWRWAPTGALLALLAVAIGTAVTAPSPETARIWTAMWLVHLLFGISIAYLCRTEFRARDLIACYLLGFAAFLGGLVVFAASITDPSFDWTYDWPVATHVRHLGYYVAAMAALAIGVLATAGTARAYAMAMAVIVAGSGFALWTGSRGTIIGIGGALICGLMLLPEVRKFRAWAGALGALAAGSALAALAAAPADNMGVGRTVVSTVASRSVTTGRTDMWRQTVEAISERPLFGYGEGQMSTVAPFANLGMPHNIVLQVGLAWGLAGIVCVAVLAAWFAYRTVPAVRREGGDLVPPFLAMAALATFSLIDNSLFNFLSVSVFAACAGLLAAHWHRSARE